jgi:hypothetical protein
MILVFLRAQTPRVTIMPRPSAFDRARLRS